MNGFFKTAILGIATILAPLASPTLAQADGARFIFVSHGQASDPLHSIVKNGAFAAASRYGVQVDYRSPQTFDMVQMSQLIDAATNQKPDGLIVTVPDPDALGPAIQRAVAAGIPVIAVNSGQYVVQKLGMLTYIGPNQEEAGLQAGQRLKALGGKKGICINVEPGNTTIDIWCNGFKEGFGGNVTVLPTKLDPADVEAKVRAALASDPQIDTILGTSAVFDGDAALKAVADSGREGKIHVATFNLSPTVLKAVADGREAFCIDQQPYLYGYLAVSFLKLYHDYGIIPVSSVYTGPFFVTKETASQVIKLASQGIR
jgi:simple sugar transport system substrate-binding protein